MECGAERGRKTGRASTAAEFGLSERHLYRQLEAAEIERRVLTHGSKEQIPERQLRPLAQLTPLEQKPAWEEAVETAPAGKVTAAHVAEVVERRLNGTPPVPPPEVLAAADDEANEEIAELEEAPEDAPDSMAIHFSSASPEWYTPRDIVDRVIAVFGAIDVDPCSNTGVPNVPAKVHYTEADDGLSHDWTGRVYMNPPYGRGIDPWIAHLVEEYERGACTEAIALVPARVDTDWFRRFEAYPWLAVDGRLKFSGHQNAAPFPSALVYLGVAVGRFVEVFGDLGVIWEKVRV